jgi:putative transposase
MDLFNGEIISYQLSFTPNFVQVVTMLRKAFKKIPNNAKPLLHFDQGWQYQMARYQKMLQQKNINQSMSRRGNFIDNAVIESFFGTLKSELYHLKRYKSVKELEDDIKSYKSYYNTERISLALNGMSPIKYRAHYQN